MVKCPKCENDMRYNRTEVEVVYEREKVIGINAELHYHCPNCTSDAIIRYNAEVVLK